MPRGAVTYNSLPAQIVGDQRCCCDKAKTMDTVVGGSATVTVGGRSAVPCSKVVTGHKGTVAIGATNVTIGGPLVIGPHARFAKICPAMAAGRENKYLIGDREHGGLNKYTRYDQDDLTHQNWNNCGQECVRMLVNEINHKNVSEWEMLRWSLENGHAAWETDRAGNQKRGAVTPTERKGYIQAESDPPGNSNPSDWTAMAKQNDLETDTFGPNPGNQPVAECLAESLRSGRPVMYSVELDFIPPLPGEQSGKGPHVVLVTGYEADENGNPVAFYVNDPMRGCAIRVEAAHLVRNRRAAAFVRPKAAAW